MILVIMGVSGSGKSTIGKLLAARLGCEFLDADDFHPQSNKDKMQAGDALTDDDRWPWLDVLASRLNDVRNQGGNCILACSALKQAYRDRLGIDQTAIHAALLSGDKQTITDRLAARQHEFMSAKLLDSQLQTLEPPKNTLVVSIAQPPETIVDQLAHYCLSVSGAQRFS